MGVLPTPVTIAAFILVFLVERCSIYLTMLENEMSTALCSIHEDQSRDGHACRTQAAERHRSRTIGAAPARRRAQRAGRHHLPALQKQAGSARRDGPHRPPGWRPEPAPP